MIKQRTLISLFPNVCFAACMALMFASCHNKKDTIHELETLSTDMNLHSANYTDDEWQEAIEKYQNLSDQLQEEELTPAELQRVGQAKGEISGYIAIQAARELGKNVSDALNEAAGFVDGFVNTAIPDAKKVMNK